MIITRETDYALRILRSLLDGELHTVGQIAQDEFLPQSFAYKILNSGRMQTGIGPVRHQPL